MWNLHPHSMRMGVSVATGKRASLRNVLEGKGSAGCTNDRLPGCNQHKFCVAHPTSYILCLVDTLQWLKTRVPSTKSRRQSR